MKFQQEFDKLISLLRLGSAYETVADDLVAADTVVSFDEGLEVARAIQLLNDRAMSADILGNEVLRDSLRTVANAIQENPSRGVLQTTAYTPRGRYVIITSGETDVLWGVIENQDKNIYTVRQLMHTYHDKGLSWSAEQFRFGKHMPLR